MKKTTTLSHLLTQATNSDVKTFNPPKLISEFKNYSTSHFSLSLYISNRDSNGELVDRTLIDFHMEKIKNTIISIFGGVSIQQLKGYFKNAQGLIMEESIAVLKIYNFNNRIGFKQVKQLLKLFFQYGNDSKQETLMLSLNNTTSIVYL